MSPTTKNILFWGFVSGIIIGTGSYVWLNVRRAMNFKYKISGFKLKEHDLTSLLIDLKLVISNPSSLNAVIHNYDFNVYVNGSKIGNIKSNKSLRVDSNADTTIVLPVRLDRTKFSDYNSFSRLYSLLLTSVQNAEKINVAIKGTLTGTAFGLSVKNYPVDITYTLKEILS